MKQTLIIAIVFFCLTANGQTKWFIKDPDGFDFIIETITEKNKINGYTRKNALTDYIGTFKLILAKVTGKIKYSEIIYFKGEFVDATNFKGNGYRIAGEFTMQGKLYNDSIIITVIGKKTKKQTSYKGIRMDGDLIHFNYQRLASQIITVTEKNLYDPRLLRAKSWARFKSHLLTKSTSISDDLEFRLAFSSFSKDLPFSHFRLLKNMDDSGLDSKIELRQLNPSTCLLDVDAFDGKKEKMEMILDQLRASNCDNLILDLRDNGGGDNETALPLANYLVSRETVGGIFPNRSWYSRNDHLPTINDLATFNLFKSGTLNEFYEKAERNNGVFIRCTPAENRFNGKLFVLINGNTGSTSEVLVQVLKENKLATIVGTKTAGALLSAKAFSLNETFKLFIPMNDYVSANGVRVDKVGIKPDVEVSGEEALEYVLSILLESRID
jgi:hypothetical protein